MTTKPTTEQAVELKLNMPIYVASRASVPERGEMWRRFRGKGFRIISSWIDEDGDGATGDFTDLWQRISDEVASAYGVVLYAEQGDFPLKGALIEVGIALGLNKPVIVCLPNVELDARSQRPIGSWINHPLVSRNDNVEDALRAIRTGATWPKFTTYQGAKEVRVRVQPRSSFTPPESCPDCAAGVPFGPDGHHVNHNKGG